MELHNLLTFLTVSMRPRSRRGALPTHMRPLLEHDSRVHRRHQHNVYRRTICLDVLHGQRIRRCVYRAMPVLLLLIEMRHLSRKRPDARLVGQRRPATTSEAVCSYRPRECRRKHWHHVSCIYLRSRTFPLITTSMHMVPQDKLIHLESGVGTKLPSVHAH